MLIFKVDGMTCGGCVGSVKRAVTNALPGIQADVDLRRGTVTVSGTAHTAEVSDKVLAAIRGAGYEAQRQAA